MKAPSWFGALQGSRRQGLSGTWIEWASVLISILVLALGVWFLHIVRGVPLGADANTGQRVIFGSLLVFCLFILPVIIQFRWQGKSIGKAEYARRKKFLELLPKTIDPSISESDFEALYDLMLSEKELTGPTARKQQKYITLYNQQKGLLGRTRIQ
ncbi:hypothetical protein COY28_02635 [Candidatus Woesearchaeota archaeon CG_4_10_14_0_2_um_filter_57_5]|nr:MAG: hypothetical protein AUJ68_01390 [Candidatus Woesearchaeota archaeon CG1_02_57_44]PIN67900.1 MAG: hypothetical protein COV94_06535 [Candidatus Woesearchaeota archaeon CG11_big_fil_rev_8_21_14_0_20_57_5]PIZ54470.1 MAG: hypothetical protein COY28_02635 [Candidatus Woesearchaeota archaeon CG_4_10_14_0_2_um_filter_57_5]